MHCLRSRDFAATYVYMCRCKWQALWAAHRRARKGGGFDHGRFETVDSAHTPGRNMVDPKSLVAHEDVELPNLFSAHQRISPYSDSPSHGTALPPLLDGARCPDQPGHTWVIGMGRSAIQSPKTRIANAYPQLRVTACL